jgi:hypothetical protein
MSLSAGRTAMWIISTGIVLASVAVLVSHGIDGIPGHWWGLLIAAVLATIAFVLGALD